MSQKKYRINEIFYTLQGEGMRAGTANVFIRFSGCNLACDLQTSATSPGGFKCDTEFTGGRDLLLDDLLKEVEKTESDVVVPANPAQPKAVVLTGGEPALQIDTTLVAGLKALGYYVAIETNGSLPLPSNLDWITLSPKVAEHAIVPRQVDELKYVRSFGQALPKPQVKADYYLISPAFTGNILKQDDLQWCVDLCKQYPKWRLSLQLHKFLRIR